MTVARYKVRAAQIVVEVSDPRREVYVVRGARLPDTATERSIARLLDRGLIAEVDAPQPVEEPPAEPAEPETPALDAMTVEQLKAHLTGQGIPFDGVALKADLLALAQQ